jgi:hypothetical protein
LNLSTGGAQNSQLEGITSFSRGVVSDFSDQTLMVNDTYVLSARLVSESRLLVQPHPLQRPQSRRRRPVHRHQWLRALRQGLDSAHGLRRMARPGAAELLLSCKAAIASAFGADINPVRTAAILQTNFGGRFHLR